MCIFLPGRSVLVLGVDGGGWGLGVLVGGLCVGLQSLPTYLLHTGTVRT